MNVKHQTTCARVEITEIYSHIFLAKREILSHSHLTEKKIRQINYLVTYSVRPLLSQKFYQKYVRENFCNFHTVEIPEILSHNFFEKISWNQWFY